MTDSKPVQNTRGIVLMAFGFFIFSMVDTQAKFLAQDFHPVQVVWVRQLGLLAGMFLLIASQGLSVLKTRRPVLQMIRGLLAVLSAITFIAAIARVPLADAVAVSFVAPFIVTVFAALILKEPVGIRRWSAVVIGFAATLIITRPGSGVMDPAIFLVIVAAGLFASRQILARMLAKDDRTATTFAYTALATSLILTFPLPFFWKWPDTSLQWTLFATIAITAALGEFLVIRALEIAEAVAVAPMQYTMIIWGTIYGYIIFGEFPDGWTLLGAAIIVLTGIYVINRERIAAREGRLRVPSNDRAPPEGK